ncbi:hypothetical protein M8C21_019647 [Ambrosia artemisiifolia]|uniref:Uncharacterized protein n=1 Tax=Ambrosia artemisiifolia TaxID=4212 RepID=A0AAD5CFJ9_AMBAR|nr:hypothetical protein M8C21_019647 [Ambrosia artemisiifolia]
MRRFTYAFRLRPILKSKQSTFLRNPNKETPSRSWQAGTQTLTNACLPEKTVLAFEPPRMANYQHVVAVHADVARKKKRKWADVEPQFGSPSMFANQQKSQQSWGNSTILLGIHPCDRRRSVSEYQCMFPAIEFSFGSAIESDEDVLWKPNIRETKEELAIRGKSSWIEQLYSSLDDFMFMHSSSMLGSDSSKTNYPGRVPSGPDVPSDEQFANDKPVSGISKANLAEVSLDGDLLMAEVASLHRNTLDSNAINGKIMVCMLEALSDDRYEKATAIEEGGGAGLILIDPVARYALGQTVIQSVLIREAEAEELQTYMKTDKSLNLIYRSCGAFILECTKIVVKKSH